LNQGFKDFFYFNKVERRGILGLLIIMMGVIFGKVYLTKSNFQLAKEKQNIARLTAQLLALEEPKQLQKDTFIDHSRSVITEQRQDSLFPFDPNKLSQAEWVKLGLSEKQAAVILNYQAKGGYFRTSEDLKKMYTISDDFFDRIEPYVIIEESKASTGHRIKNKSKSEQDPPSELRKWKKEKLIVDINQADSLTFKKLYGIGPYFSGKMVAYREQLGGYHSKLQLTEIWNFDDSLLNQLDSQLIVGKVELRKLSINTASARQLKKHPYIDWNIANSIVQIRDRHGPYRQLDELKKSVLIDDSLLQKLSPYLTTD
jgi:DNA uptake protein ComE-like DNA-binding protein